MAAAGNAQFPQSFTQWLAETAGRAGPTRYWRMADAGSIMTADIGGIDGIYQNTAALELGITDAENETWVGFGGSANPGYATIETPLQSAALTA